MLEFRRAHWTLASRRSALRSRGRISDRRIDPGNLVQGGGSGAEGTLLTTINALDPIYFSFDASEALFLKARRARESGAAQSDVQIRLQDEGDYRWHGRLDFTDNGLDRRSGTIRLRAVVPNASQFLTPGMFGNMRLSMHRRAKHCSCRIRRCRPIRRARS